MELRVLYSLGLPMHPQESQTVRREAAVRRREALAACAVIWLSMVILSALSISFLFIKTSMPFTGFYLSYILMLFYKCYITK